MSSGAPPKPDFVRFTTSRAFTTRLVLSTLTGRPVHISKIRSGSLTAPGLAPHEVSFLRLLEAVTNGSAIDVSYTGTTITYQPGLIAGSVAGRGASLTAAGDALIEHSVPATNARGAAYFLLPLALLAPFSKAPLNVRLHGPGVITSTTHTTGDISIDAFRTAVLPLYGLFGIPPARVELRVLARSCAGPGGRGGGGVVEFRSAAQVRLPKTLHLHRRPGRVRRVRGVAYATGVAASHNARMIAAAREVLGRLVPDVHVAAQYDPAPLVAVSDEKSGNKNNDSGKDRDKARATRKRKLGIGFGIALVAETATDGVVYQADEVAPSSGGVVPEDVGRRCAWQLLETVAQGGCVSAAATGTVLVLMAMGAEDVGRVRLGRDVAGREETMQLARDLRKFGAPSWGIRQAEDDEGEEPTGDLIVAVKGMGLGNVGRKAA